MYTIYEFGELEIVPSQPKTVHIQTFFTGGLMSKLFKSLCLVVLFSTLLSACAGGGMVMRPNYQPQQQRVMYHGARCTPAPIIMGKGYQGGSPCW